MLGAIGERKHNMKIMISVPVTLNILYDEVRGYVHEDFKDSPLYTKDSLSYILDYYKAKGSEYIDPYDIWCDWVYHDSLNDLLEFYNNEYTFSDIRRRSDCVIVLDNGNILMKDF